MVQKKLLFIIAFLFGSLEMTYAQFTLCENCGEQKQGNTIVIQGENKGKWTVKYSLWGHKTSFITPDNQTIVLQSVGDKKENADGSIIRNAVSEDGIWSVEVHYKGKTFIKAIMRRK